MRKRSFHCAMMVVFLCGVALPTASGVSRTRPDGDGARSSPTAVTLFNGWKLSPAGRHVRVGDLTQRMALSPDGRMLAAVSGGYTTALFFIDVETGNVKQTFPLKEAANGLAFSREGRRLLVSGGDTGLINVFDYANGELTPQPDVAPAPDASPVFLGHIAVHPENGRYYVCNEANHEIWILHPDTLKREGVIPVGQHPHTCAFGADRRHLYVSNWGSRSISIVDTETDRRIRDITVGLRPNDLTVSPDGRLFVTCSGDNTVHVIQTRVPETPGEPAGPSAQLPSGAREILSTSLYPQSPEGSTPDAVAVSPDGKTLFVANADNNSVMVVDISESGPGRSRPSVVEGFIPVGWYPTALLVSRDGGALFVANGKGLRSRSNVIERGEPGSKPPAWTHIGRTFEGWVSFIAKPDAAQMAAYTEQVRDNCPYRPEWMRRAPIKSNSIIPDRPGQPCPIKYVLYVIKENRTYDQVFGAFRDTKGRPRGNGDPSLVLYGEDVTPNQHRMARDYVLLDNLYCNGEVSVDGHSWCDAAIATDYNQRSWILSYSGHGRLPGNDEMMTPASGYLWDLCRRYGVSYKTYGEMASRVPSSSRGTWPGGRDMDRVSGWIEDLKTAEKNGELPRLAIMSLGENHTRGTTPGAFTPEACVASNDIGLARILEAASRSRFWKEMAIFVIEDDAQNGPDHVDAHRTAGLVLSPWARRGFVDSTLYTTASMVRTIELILGLPPMTQYDAAATPMFNCFRNRAKRTAFQPLTPKVDLTAVNPLDAPGARQSALMNFDEYDRVPEDELNRILWRAAKGPNVPYRPPIHRAIFAR